MVITLRLCLLSFCAPTLIIMFRLLLLSAAIITVVLLTLLMILQLITAADLELVARQKIIPAEFCLPPALPLQPAIAFTAFWVSLPLKALSYILSHIRTL